jgi:hypothetical protein
MVSAPSKGFASYSPRRHLLRQQGKSVLRDHQLLVRRHYEEDNPALRPRNERFAFGIGRRVEQDAKPCKLLRDASADRWRVLTNTGREHERIEPGQRREPSL